VQYFGATHETGEDCQCLVVFLSYTA